MPPIAYGQDDLNKLYKRVCPSVVSVNSYATKNYSFNFFTGFIVYSDRSRSLICVHKSVIEVHSTLYVHFSDGSTEKATVFLEKTASGHAVLVTESRRGHARSGVSFSQCEPRREEIFTIAEVEGGYSGFNFMTGTIISPSCKAEGLRLKLVPESERKFALSCPAVIRPEMVIKEQLEVAKRQIIGAAVFDLEGSLIGTITSLDELTYDLKFAQQACHWVDELEAELKAKDEKISLSKKARKGRPGPSGTKKGPNGTKKRKLKDYDEQIHTVEEKGSSMYDSLNI